MDLPEALHRPRPFLHFPPRRLQALLCFFLLPFRRRLRRHLGFFPPSRLPLPPSLPRSISISPSPTSPSSSTAASRASGWINYAGRNVSCYSREVSPLFGDSLRGIGGGLRSPRAGESFLNRTPRRLRILLACCYVTRFGVPCRFEEVAELFCVC